jgi:prolyl-tRNA synthetase
MLVALYAARHRVHRNVSHLIRVGLTYTESQRLQSVNLLVQHRTSTSLHNMASLDPIIQSLQALSIKPTASVSHSATTSPAAWRDALLGSESAPKSFELIKTLVYKPKTAKTATPSPVVVIARDETETNSGAIGRKLGLKDLRLASGDLLTEFFSLDKDSRMSFAHPHDYSSILGSQYLLLLCTVIRSQKL